MSRIPLTPGWKERISANAGRIFIGAWTCKELDFPNGMEGCRKWALEQALLLEQELTDALCPDPENDP